MNVLAAGNQGHLADSWSKLGVETSHESFRSVLVNDWVTVVGGSTRQGSLSSITSPNSGHEVYALAEGVPFQVDGKTLSANGTSLSAPLVASFAVQSLAEHPNWGPAEVEEAMKGT